MQPEDRTREMAKTAEAEKAAETAERLQVIGSSILRAARDELYLGMRFLDVALSSFSYQMDGAVHGFGTDGRVMYFQPQMLGGLYKENRILVNRYRSGTHYRWNELPEHPLLTQSSAQGNVSFA